MIKFQFGEYHGFISAKQESRASSCIPYSSFISAGLKFGDLYVQRYSINLRGIKLAYVLHMFGCMCIQLLYFDDRLPSPAE